MVAYKIAENSDWDMLLRFYTKAYRVHHPLQNREFWNWQFGNEKYGRAIIGIFENEIVAHLGNVGADNYFFGINLYIDEEFRKGDAYLNLIEIAFQMGNNQIGLSVSSDALPLLRIMKWYQYANLERKLIIHPEFSNKSISDILRPIENSIELPMPKGHFWEQPTLKSVEFEDGSTAIVHNETGGLRFVTIKNAKKVTQQAFEMGFQWCDYITSFNNPILMKLENNKWKTEAEIEIPWLLNPIEFGSKSHLRFLSKTPIDINFYINRTHADLGRVGSIIK
jgi:hypothetical protein